MKTKKKKWLKTSKPFSKCLAFEFFFFSVDPFTFKLFRKKRLDRIRVNRRRRLTGFDFVHPSHVSTLVFFYYF